MIVVIVTVYDFIADHQGRVHRHRCRSSWARSRWLHCEGLDVAGGKYLRTLWVLEVPLMGRNLAGPYKY